MNTDNNSHLQQAETLYQKALELYLGVSRTRNLIQAKELLEESAQLGCSKSAILLGDLYRNQTLPSHHLKEVVRAYERGCELNDAIAFCRLANCYSYGYGVKIDKAKALELYQKAYEMGDAKACFYIANMYIKGYVVEPNDAKVIEWYEKGVDRGDCNCACNLAYHYYKGIGIDKDTDKAKALFESHAQHHTHIQHDLGTIYYNHGNASEAEIQQAIHWFTMAANNGDARSMRTLGRIYRDHQLYEQAREWYYQAALYDAKEGAYQYAAFLMIHYKHEEDLKECFQWMKRAAEQNHAAAQFKTGLFYKCGVGTEVNHPKAYYWFLRSAENEFEQAYSHVGRYYRDGRYLKINYKNALYWFEQAISSQNPNVKGEALYDYGVMFLNGWGVKQNRAKAIGYFTEAKELDCMNAINKLKELNEAPTKEDCAPESENFGQDEASTKMPCQPTDSFIITHGNIFEFIEMKIANGSAPEYWEDHALERLNIYVECAKKKGLIKKNEKEEWMWQLNITALSIWGVHVSERLNLYDKCISSNGDEIRKFYCEKFARLFLTRKGEKIKGSTLRSYFSKYNTLRIEGPKNQKYVQLIEEAEAMANKEINEIFPPS